MPGEYTEFDMESRFFFLKCKFACVKARRCTLSHDSEAMPFARGVREHARKKNLRKMMQFDIFW